jgi:hypothetical protein
VTVVEQVSPDSVSFVLRNLVHEALHRWHPFLQGRQRSLMRYIKQYDKTAKPFRCAYADPTRRIG